MSTFIEKIKTGIYRKGHWLHLAKLNSNLCPSDLTKRYFILVGINKQCDKYIFRGIENTKNGQKLKKIDKPLSYTTVRGYVVDLLANIDLIPKTFGLHIRKMLSNSDCLKKTFLYFTASLNFTLDVHPNNIYYSLFCCNKHISF